jgi:Protein of unknown function (DUF3551)
MRRAFWALIVCCAASVISTPPAPARDMPFCIKGCDFEGGGGVGDCSFTTYQQCQATASGLTATCAANPYYSAKAELQPNRTRVSRRKF